MRMMMVMVSLMKEVGAESDPLEQRVFPSTPPFPQGTDVVWIDDDAPANPRLRNGTPETPYRSITEALRALRDDEASNVETLILNEGHYSVSRTGEIFPLDFRQLSGLDARPLTLRSEQGPANTTIDAEFTADAIILNRGVTIEGVSGVRGNRGIGVLKIGDTTIRDSWIMEHNQEGIVIGIANAEDDIEDAELDSTIIRNTIARNGAEGLEVIAGSRAMLSENMILDNIGAGVEITNDSYGLLRHNHIERNGRNGVSVFFDSTAVLESNEIRDNRPNGVQLAPISHLEMTENIVEANADVGIVIEGSTAMLSHNQVLNNPSHGIDIWTEQANQDRRSFLNHNTLVGNNVGVIIREGTMAVLTANTSSNNYDTGVWLQNHAWAAINEGRISDNAFGIYIQGESRAEIALSGDVLTMSANQHNGVKNEITIVDESSLARLDSTRIIFDDPMDADNIRGRCEDVAPMSIYCNE